MRHSLRVLGGFTGDALVDSCYGAVLDVALVPAEVEEARIRRHIFLARFARQNVLQWDDVEGRVVRRYVSMLSQFLREEGDAVQAAMRSGSSEV